MMEHYIIVPSGDHCTYIQSRPGKTSFRKITNMDHNQRTSIKKYLHTKTKVLLRLKFLTLVQEWSQSDLMTRMNILTIFKIPTNIINVLIQKNKTWKIMRSNKKNYIKTQMMTWSLKNNSNIFTQTLITIFNIQQWTQVSCQFIILNRKTSSMIQRILPIPQLTPKCTQGQNNSSNGHQS